MFFIPTTEGSLCLSFVCVCEREREGEIERERYLLLTREALIF